MPRGQLLPPFSGTPLDPKLDTPTTTYLHTDHLGSVSVATNSSGNLVSSQEYDPWGATISGGVSQTTLNYTGQRLDSTGLLYYHARYYDPALGRFTSPDSIVPGGDVGKEQNSLLTVDFHESGFASSLQRENQQVLRKGFWFQLSGQDKQRAKEPWGPGNPQALNRYSYVLDNPVRYVDPTGHDRRYSLGEARALAKDLAKAIELLTNWKSGTVGTLSPATFVSLFVNPWVGALMLAATWYTGDQFDALIDALQFMENELDTWLRAYEGVADDAAPEAWISIGLDYDGNIVTRNNVINGPNGDRGAPGKQHVRQEWVWWRLAAGSDVSPIQINRTGSPGGYRAI